MQDFVYQSAPMRVVFGTGTLRQLPDELSRLGVTRALVLATPRQNDLVAGALQQYYQSPTPMFLSIGAAAIAAGAIILLARRPASAPASSLEVTAGLRKVAQPAS